MRSIVHQRGDGLSHILGCRETSTGIAQLGKFGQLLDARNLARSGRNGNSGLNGVRGDSLGHELESKLADMRFEHRLGRRDGTVSGNYTVPPSAGQSVDAASL